MTKENEERGLNILCIDGGGGVRGLSSLLLLQEVMNRLENLEGGNELLEPANFFHMLAGSGMGGLSACMLGRLQMPLKMAIQEYANLAQEVFSDKKIIRKSGPSVYKGSKLREVLKGIIRRAGNDNEMMEREVGPEECKTVIFAMSNHNMTGALPTIFRSYRVTANRAPQCTILDALCATLAHPDLFKEIEIEEDGVHQSFVSGDLGCSNPIAHVLTEAKRVYPGRYVSSILSIGAGHARTISMTGSGSPRHILYTEYQVAVQNMATDNERAAQEMDLRFGATQGFYFRLNVDQGIQDVGQGDWEKLGEVVAHTKAYLLRTEVNQRIEQLVKAIHTGANAIETAYIDGQIQQNKKTRRAPRIKICPDPTNFYIGREDEMKQVRQCLLAIGSVVEPPICVVYGLGGAGKTQLALAVIKQTRHMWKEVLYIDGTSRQTIEGALRGLAEVKNLGCTHQAAISWLELCQDPWLMLIDNVDDPSVGRSIRHYLPGGPHGSVLITTRLADLTVLARGPDSICHVSPGMSPKDSLELLINVARLAGKRLPEEETKEGMALVKDFGYFALAAVHAGAYIGHSPGLKISKYRRLFLSHRQRMLEEYSKLLIKVDDYTKTVYTTWEMCYNLLKRHSRPMLWLMAFLHHDFITEEIFERAATNLSLDPKAWIFLLPPTETLINAYIHVEEYLSQFLDHTGRWDSLQFLNVINEIASYSLIDSDRTNSTFSIHILVQDWAKTKIEQDLEMATECTAVLLSLSIGFSDSSESRGFMADLEVHLNHFLSQQKQANVKDYHRQFSRAYCELERWQKAKELETNIYKEMKRIRGEKHIYTLGCMTNLASLFLNAGHFSMAETLQTNVLNIQREVLGPEHSHTIRSVTNLASIYLKQGRWDEVECLQLQAFSSGSNDSITKSSTGSVALLSDQRAIGILGPVLTEDSWNMLRGKTNLALAYLNQGRLNEAEILQADVLCTYQRIFTREGPHPDMIISMINLASIYSRKARWGEAEKLQIEIIELQEALFGREDSRTLTSTAELGAIYSKQGRWAEAEVLQWEITKSYTALLGAGHPGTLCIKTELGVTYAGQQRWDEAEELQLLVLNMRLQQLGEYHQETLRNMSELVSIYMNKYQWAMAEEMQKRLLTARNYKQESAEDGSNVLLDTERMAKIYTELGQLTKAEALCAKALAIQAKAFGKISSDTQALIQDIQHRTRLNRQRFPVRSLLCVTAELGKSMYAKMPTANIGSRGSFAWIMLIVLLVLLHYPCISKRQVETELPKSPAGLHRIFGNICLAIIGCVIAWILREQYGPIRRTKLSHSHISVDGSTV